MVEKIEHVKAMMRHRNPKGELAAGLASNTTSRGIDRAAAPSLHSPRSRGEPTVTEAHAERGTLEGVARGARVASIAAGLWLTVSVSLMRIPIMMKMPWIAAGLAIAVLAFGALLVEPRLRVGNIVISLLLFGAAVVLPIGQGTLLLDILVVESIVLGSSVVPDGEGPSFESDLRNPPPHTP